MSRGSIASVPALCGEHLRQMYEAGRTAFELWALRNIF
jgi:hypothetical protein